MLIFVRRQHRGCTLLYVYGAIWLITDQLMRPSHDKSSVVGQKKLVFSWLEQVTFVPRQQTSVIINGKFRKRDIGMNKVED